jgi:starch synthase
MQSLTSFINADFYNNYNTDNPEEAKIRNKVRKFLRPSPSGVTKLQQLENFFTDLKAGKSPQELRNSYQHLKKSSGYFIEEAIYRAFKNSGLRAKEIAADPCFGKTMLTNNDLKEIFNQTFFKNNRNTTLLPEMIKLFKEQKPLKGKLIEAMILSDLAKLYQEAQGPKVEQLRSKINEIVESLNKDREKILSFNVKEKLGFHVWENEGSPKTPNYDGQAAFAKNPSLLHKKGPNGKISAIEVVIGLIRADIERKKHVFMDQLETTFVNCDAERLSLMDPANLQKIRPILIGVEYRGLCSAGGLAEAITGMAEGLFQQLGSEEGKVRVILPKYSTLGPILQKNNLHLEDVPLLSTDDYKISKTTKNGVNLYFIDDKYKHFELKEHNPYGKGEKHINTRFACFSYYAANLSLTLADLIKREGNIPVVHLHDWHTAGAAQLIKDRNKKLPVVYTYHNNDYTAQGIYDPKGPNLPRFRIRGDNLSLAGIRNADHVTTVSRSFAKESMTSMYGFGIHNDIIAVAKQNKLTGITNGSDPSNWNPETNQQLKNWKDPNGNPIDLTFSANDPNIAARKRVIKEQLQKWFDTTGREYGFEIKIDPNKPLTYFVGRFTKQKGLDLLEAAADEIVNRGGQFICVGTLHEQDKEGSDYINRLQGKFSSDKDDMKKNCCIISDIKVGESYEIQGQIGALIRAAADFIVVPSVFEPCGLVQYEAWLFGADVIASKLGGLADTVEWDNGILFERMPNLEDSKKEFRKAIGKAHEHLRSLAHTDRQNRLHFMMDKAKKAKWTGSVRGQLSPISQYLCVYEKAIKDSVIA